MNELTRFFEALEDEEDYGDVSQFPTPEFLVDKDVLSVFEQALQKLKDTYSAFEGCTYTAEPSTIVGGSVSWDGVVDEGTGLSITGVVRIQNILVPKAIGKEFPFRIYYTAQAGKYAPRANTITIQIHSKNGRNAGRGIQPYLSIYFEYEVITERLRGPVVQSFSKGDGALIKKDAVQFLESLEDEESEGDISQFQNPDEAAKFDPQHALGLLTPLIVDLLKVEPQGDWVIEKNWEQKDYASLFIAPPRDYPFIEEAKMIVKLEPNHWCYYNPHNSDERNELTNMTPKLEVIVGNMWSLIDLPQFGKIFYDRFKRELVVGEQDEISYSPPQPTKKKGRR